MSDLLVVKAKLKDLAKGFNVSGDFADALDKKVRAQVDEALERAKSNGRKTLYPRDL